MKFSRNARLGVVGLLVALAATAGCTSNDGEARPTSTPTFVAPSPTATGPSPTPLSAPTPLAGDRNVGTMVPQRFRLEVDQCERNANVVALVRRQPQRPPIIDRLKVMYTVDGVQSMPTTDFQVTPPTGNDTLSWVAPKGRGISFCEIREYYREPSAGLSHPNGSTTVPAAFRTGGGSGKIAPVEMLGAWDREGSYQLRHPQDWATVELIGFDFNMTNQHTQLSVGPDGQLGVG